MKPINYPTSSRWRPWHAHWCLPGFGNLRIDRNSTESPGRFCLSQKIITKKETTKISKMVLSIIHSFDSQLEILKVSHAKLHKGLWQLRKEVIDGSGLTSCLGIIHESKTSIGRYFISCIGHLIGTTRLLTFAKSGTFRNLTC